MAKINDGNYFTLTSSMKRSELRELRKHESFFCPQCNEKVLLKVGDIVIPHFAHQQDRLCRSMFSEGESMEHLLGKQQLYEFLQQSNHLDVQLEPYFKKIAQRPDLLVTTTSEVIPIEFQCSQIPLRHIAERTEGYMNAGMNPIWILRTPHKLQKLPQGITTYSLSQFEEKFLTDTPTEGLVFLTYEPNTKKFHYLSALLHVSGRQFIGKHRVLSLDKQSFPFARPKPPTREEIQHYYSLHSSLRVKFLKSRIFYNRKGIHDSFLRRCYELKLIPSELPKWIGVPIAYKNVFTEHAAEWQLAFLHFVEMKNMNLHQVTLKHIREFTHRYGRQEKDAVEVCERYLTFLFLIGVKSVHDCVNVKDLEYFEILFTQYLQRGMKIEKI
ncbi:competence protein CoiA [Sporosarcina ureilytica]|uniref:Competence protein CoiA n=1 Tax=Sporosarcina ureilytica TaxID=298596 RepID=A0A1D8JIA6_9BACL|nr:competence protein CoiA family protein [Sporosarcina ureilytica]AOV08451.1 hypothetical protein BI350_13515 [Sporosarcina ureilytica]